MFCVFGVFNVYFVFMVVFNVCFIFFIVDCYVRFLLFFIKFYVLLCFVGSNF